ncbi:MAG: 2-amino-4-hydroxy-6-hydroxymethyldihydropteridine diphosphokinase [Victivallaceae bacterium]|jgi:2-amino-4-hydroxy-6-hydroxymethyldihydropteridine diphosphokinase
MMIKTALALGGNLGDVAGAFKTAAQKFEAAGMINIKLSRFHRTAPIGCAPGSPDFLNAALTGEWSGAVEELFGACQKIECESGRAAVHGINAPRTLDIDIILFGGRIIRSDTLRIPHFRAAQRLFVIAPLAEIAPEMIFPDTGKKVSDIFKSLRSG